MFEEWFDVKVPNDTMGCLQDIHWSMGAFGYFPTYTLGNLYAAQLLESMQDELGDIDALVSSGDWSSLLQWLRPRIHEQGSKMSPAELIELGSFQAIEGKTWNHPVVVGDRLYLRNAQQAACYQFEND